MKLKVSTIRQYLISTCVSFTIVSLVQQYFFVLDDSKVPVELPYHIFIVCFFINFTMMLTNQIPIESTILRYLIDIVDMIVVYFFMNIFVFETDLMELGISTMFEMVIFLVITYIIVIAIVSVKNKVDEKNINEVIKKRKRLIK